MSIPWGTVGREKNRQVLKIAAIVTGLLCPSTPAEVPLVQDGRAVTTIVVPDQASEAEQVSAEDIQWHVLKMSGAKLPILGETDRPAGPCIDIGATVNGLAWRKRLADRDDLNDEAMVIEVTDDYAVLVGRTDQATAHAAVAVLEQLGCRWLFPTEQGAYIPKLSTVKVGTQSMIDQPAFILRQGLPVRNILGPSEPLATPRRTWNRHVSAWSRRNRLGGLRWAGGGHSYSKLVPPKTYFSEHPEYYSLRDGKRTKQQLCTTHPEVVRIAIQTATGWAKEWPGRLVGAGPNDTEKFCQCENCKQLIFEEGNHYDLIVDFANKVARGVRKECPEAKIVFFANYHTGMAPPVRVKPEPNLVFWVTRWCVDRFHSLHHPNVKSFKDAIDKWSEYGREHQNMTILYTYYGHYSDFVYYPIVSVLSDEFPYFLEHNIRGLYSETHQHWGCQGLNFYVFSRLMWNPREDVEALVDEYCRLAFGPAGNTMRQYYELLERTAKQSSGFRGHIEEVPRIFTASAIGQADILMAEAVREVREHLASRPDPGLEWRMALAAGGQRLAKLYLSSQHRLKQYVSSKLAGEDPNQAVLGQVRDDLVQVVEMMKDPEHPELVGVGFVETIEEDLQHLTGRLVYGPGRFKYTDNFSDIAQAALTSRTLKGFAPGTHGLELNPHSSGELSWRFESEQECTFQTAKLFQVHIKCRGLESGGSNELSVCSLLTGNEYVTVMRNETLSSKTIDLTQHVKGTEWFDVRFRAYNALDKRVLSVDKLSVFGTVAQRQQFN